MEEVYKIYHDKTYRNKRLVYEISNKGNIKRNGILLDLSKQPTTSGYITFYHKILLHRAVAELFIPNVNNYKCIDHIDGNKYNNDVTNLRWCTHKENNNNPITKQRRKDSLNNPETKKLKSKVRLNYLLNNNIAITGWKWMSDDNIEVLLAPKYWGEFIDDGFKFGRLHRKK